MLRMRSDPKRWCGEAENVTYSSDTLIATGSRLQSEATLGSKCFFVLDGFMHAGVNAQERHVVVCVLSLR